MSGHERVVARRSVRRLLPSLLALAAVATITLAPRALAHAQLRETDPPSGAVVKSEPTRFVFRFDEAVQGGVGAVRVFDAQGARVDDDAVEHPGGDASAIAVGLKRGLAPGTYIATYRVVSLDTHVVSGGAVFSIGHAGTQPSVTVAGLLSKGRTGRATLLAFGVVRALGYLAIALFVGALVFLLAVWPAAVAAPAADGAWRRAQEAFATRVTWLLLAVAALGATSCALAFGLQGAEQAGVSFWAALNGEVIAAVRHTDFGTWWGTRLLDWLLLTALVALAAILRARGRVRGSRGVRVSFMVAAALAAAYLLATVALSGHAYSQSPRALLLALDVAHVGAMCVWLGGLALLTLAVPAATRCLEPAQRTRVLTALLGRFSPLALASVIVLAASGVAQAYVHVRTLDALTGTGYGRDVLLKTGLLLALIALGYTQRERVLPALRASARARRSPGRVGFLLRRVLRAELALLLVVLGVTAALVDYVPPVVEASGPVNVTRRIGPAQLELTVEPARVGVNEIHIYLLNARTGAPFAGVRELGVQAALPSRQIGPQSLRAVPSGPGHYTIAAATLVPGGDWQLRLAMRVSEFDEYVQTVSAPIR